MMSSAILCKTFRATRKPFRARAKTVRLPDGIAVRLQPGILFVFTPESFSRSPRNPFRLAPESAHVGETSLGSATDLVRQEIVDLISSAIYPDVKFTWCIPEVVRHEREYQMQQEAPKLRGSINRIERLLQHNLAL